MIDLLLSDLASADGASHSAYSQAAEILDALPRRIITFNPDHVVAQHAVIRELLAEARREQAAAYDRMRRRIVDDLEAMLQRQERIAAEASLPDRVAALEATVAELRRTIEASPALRVVRRDA